MIGYVTRLKKLDDADDIIFVKRTKISGKPSFYTRCVALENNWITTERDDNIVFLKLKKSWCNKSKRRDNDNKINAFLA